MVQSARGVSDQPNQLLSGEPGYRALARHFPNGSVVLFDRDLRYAIVEGAGLAEFGLSKSDLEGKTIWEAFDAEVAEFLRPKFEAALRGESVSFEVTQDERFYVARVVPVEDDANDIIGGMVMTQNVTAERQADQALRKAEARYRSLVESVPAVVYVDQPDAESSNLYISPQVEALLGYPLERWSDDPEFWITILHPDDRDRVLADLAASGEHYLDEYRLIASDGRVVWIHDEAVEVRDADGQSVCRQGMWIEVTERKHAERALQQSEEKFRAFVETTREWVWAVDRDGRQVYSNPAVAGILGYEPEELIGKRAVDFMHEDDRQRILQQYPDWVERGEGWSAMVLRWKHRDGSQRFLESSSVPILDEQGDFVGYRGADRDVTDRVVAEQESHRLLSQLMREQEQERRDLAADIHDDQIQKMTAVGLRLQALCNSTQEPAQIEAITQTQGTVTDAITRLRRLVFDLHPRSLDSEGLAAALRVHLEEIEQETDIECTFGNHLVTEPNSEVRLIAYRVAKEALTNVRKHSEATKVWLILAQQGDDLCVRIRDNGRGFGGEQEVPRHLAFSSMRERVRLAGGRLRLSDRPGGGSLVEFELPLA